MTNRLVVSTMVLCWLGAQVVTAQAASSTAKPAMTEPAHDIYVVVMCNYFPVDHPQVFPESGISESAAGTDNAIGGYCNGPTIQDDINSQDQ
ncbi:hypothetical protein [Burkholderia alba]|uniref:hypothetical protein n=1 Tax=Burkholderia alba TaxID=2683677 RepID=UPI002B05B3F1|nr:hypothetical protein [Burkholderia alba]